MKETAWSQCHHPGPQFIKWLDVLAPNPVKSGSCQIGCYNDCITLKLDRHLPSTAAKVPVKFQSDWTILNTNLTAPTFAIIIILSDIETRPRVKNTIVGVSFACFSYLITIMFVIVVPCRRMCSRVLFLPRASACFWSGSLRHKYLKCSSQIASRMASMDQVSVTLKLLTHCDKCGIGQNGRGVWSP